MIPGTEYKVYVDVLVAFRAGKMVPARIRWTDGTIYKIDKIVDVRPAAARKAGGQGDRYTVQINGRESYLYFEYSTDPCGEHIGDWFVEKKNI